MENGVKQRIKEIIEATDNSVNSFAKAIGVKQTTLCDYLNSGKTPSWAVIRGIIDACTDVSVEWLLRGEGSMYTKDIPQDGDTDAVVDLKAEITRLLAITARLTDQVTSLERERDTLMGEVQHLTTQLARSESRLDKLIDILHQEPEPRFSIVAEEQTYNHRNNIEL